MGDEPPACPWWAFHDPDVCEVLNAHDFWGDLSQWWGDDPPYWLVRGVGHFRKVLNLVEADALKELAKRERDRRASEGGGGGFSVRG